jgi:hypothetical protein
MKRGANPLKSARSFIETRNSAPVLETPHDPKHRSTAGFENPDHVAVSIHSYRWRLKFADGEAKYDEIEKQLAAYGRGEGPDQSVRDADSRRASVEQRHVLLNPGPAHCAGAPCLGPLPGSDPAICEERLRSVAP